MTYIYPTNLVDQIRKNWDRASFGSHAPELPEDGIIRELLETCYHASFLTEEQRGLAFRVIYCEKDLLKEQYDAVKRHYISTRIIEFQQPREFSIGELMRLTPATDFRKVLIGVERKPNRAKKPKLLIWGLIETGSSWWDFIHGESCGGMPPPDHLTISSNRPGYLSISRQGNIVVSLRAGQVSSPIRGVIYDGPVGDFFGNGAQHMYDDVNKELGVDRYDEEGHDDDYPKQKYLEYIERVLFHIREMDHGGVLIVVPDHLEANDPRIKDRLTIKYPIDYNDGWNLTLNFLSLHRQYYDMHFPLWNAKTELSRDNYRNISLLESRRKNVDRALSDSIRFVASLSGVDGAVLITDKLRILGFGCEVVAQSHSLEHARLSSKAKVTGNKKVPIQSYGTRHRSTFRFCSSFEDAVAFIVSQDGGVKAVRRVGANLVLWPDINIGIFGL